MPSRQKPSQKDEQFFSSFGSVFRAASFSQGSGEKKKMRACFLGQNVCALGFGVAMLQTPPMMAEPAPRSGPTPNIIPDETPIRPGNEPSADPVAAFHPAVPDPLPHAPPA
jgi:hypothetical protein